MKKLLIVVLCLMFATTAFAQVKTYGTLAAGSLMKKGGTSVFGFFAGANTPIFTDDSSGFMVLNRTGYFYADRPEDIQGVSTWLISQRSIVQGSKFSLYVAIGGGYLYEIEDGSDDHSSGFKLEFGSKLWNKLRVSLGCDYTPIKGEGDEAFVYGLVDISP